MINKTQFDLEVYLHTRLNLQKRLKEIEDGKKETIEYNLNECLKRGILPEYVKLCKEILHNL